MDTKIALIFALHLFLETMDGLQDDEYKSKRYANYLCHAAISMI